MRRKRTRRSGRPISAATAPARAIMRRLYELIWKRALASQMASARLERTTAELADGTGQHGAARDRPGRALPRLPRALRGRPRRRRGRGQPPPAAPARGRHAGQEERSTAEQHFTQPPPRYSEASLVKRMEELGIGRPSTYAATLQTLKDRDYVRLEKNRFFPEESGRLLTAFLERFFERYVSYDFTADLEDELDDISGGRAAVAGGARGLLARLQAEDRRGDGAEAVRDHRRARRVPRALAVPGQGRRQRSAALPGLRRGPARRCAAAGSAPSSPAPTIPSASSPAASARAARRRRGCRAAGARPGSRDRPGRHAALGPLRALFPARRRQGGQARLDPQGRAGGGRRPRARRCGCCRCRARSATIPRPASRSPPASAATAPISPMTANMRSSPRPPRCSRSA